MSIVGTRPPLISETNLYELHHKARLAIKPGITGMWQVSGRSDITDFEEVVRLDREYISKCSTCDMNCVINNGLSEASKEQLKHKTGEEIVDADIAQQMEK